MDKSKSCGVLGVSNKYHVSIFQYDTIVLGMTRRISGLSLLESSLWVVEINRLWIFLCQVLRGINLAERKTSVSRPSWMRLATWSLR